MAGPAAAQQRNRRALRRVNHLDFVIVGVGYIQHPVMPSHPQGMLQADMMPRAVKIPELKKAQAHDGAYPAVGGQIRRADGAGFAVGKVKAVAIGGNAAGLSQVSPGQAAIGDVFRPGAGIGADFPIG